jgi:hypothetical protein
MPLGNVIVFLIASSKNDVTVLDQDIIAAEKYIVCSSGVILLSRLFYRYCLLKWAHTIYGIGATIIKPYICYAIENYLNLRWVFVSSYYIAETGKKLLFKKRVQNTLANPYMTDVRVFCSKTPDFFKTNKLINITHHNVMNYDPKIFSMSNPSANKKPCEFKPI